MAEEMDLNDHHTAVLHCTNCCQAVVVKLSRGATGNLTIKCPKCGHEHYRHCKDGEITEDRWQVGGMMVPSYMYTTAATSCTATCASTASMYVRDLWSDSGTASW